MPEDFESLAQVKTKSMKHIEDFDYQDHIREAQEQKQMRDDDYLYEAAERREIWDEMYYQWRDNN